MTNPILAAYADVAAYSAIAVLAIAMLGFTLDLAKTVSRRAALPSEPELAASAHESSARPAGARTTVLVGPRPEPTARPAPGPPRRSASIAMATSWLGTGLLVAAAVMRGSSVGRVPWGNMYEFSLTGSAAVMLTFLALSRRTDVRWLGLFVVGPVVLTLGVAVTVFYSEASPLLPSLRSYWLVIHVSIAILAVALFTLAFAVTVLHMLQSRREADQRGPRGILTALPNSSALDRLGYGLHVAAFPLWTFTLIAGAIWAQEAWGAYWQWDPKEVWTFVIWVVYAAYLHARATAGWSQRATNVIALAGYGCIIVNYTVVNMYFVGLHSYSGM